MLLSSSCLFAAHLSASFIALIRISSILLLSLSLTGLGQQLNYNKINFYLLDSLILEEVNERRKNLGKSVIAYSKVIHNGVSKNQTRILLTEQRVYHPNKKRFYDF